MASSRAVGVAQAGPVFAIVYGWLRAMPGTLGLLAAALS